MASNWGLVDTTIDITLIVTGIVFVAVNLFLAYCILRFRHRPGRKADYDPENANAKSNRPDDADKDVILNRIEVYERETYPVLDAYPKKLLARVNADQPPLAVLRDVAECLCGVVPAKI